MDAYSSNYSDWNADKNWSSQELKSDGLMEVRTGRLLCEQQSGLFTQHTGRFIVCDDDINSNTVTESDMSLKSRSFMHTVNDRVRKMLDQFSKDATQDSNKHSFKKENVYVFDITSIYFHGKGLTPKANSLTC